MYGKNDPKHNRTQVGGDFNGDGSHGAIRKNITLNKYKLTSDPLGNHKSPWTWMVLEDDPSLLAR